jgi:hypothetical protein
LEALKKDPGSNIAWASSSAKIFEAVGERQQKNIDSSRRRRISASQIQPQEEKRRGLNENRRSERVFLREGEARDRGIAGNTGFSSER